ncbi:MAG: hypothetical protein KUF77_12600 [Candidatus Thiodiazotropha sp. (ex Lucina aurantia)]|nr:hypothetical protein [Candidatus Thiodiazotropha sp. (ex Lucina pensylvanica)]MBT3024687.1 hypothetical protein [Candidatus Thiodiazotropha taylori]MBV2098827.1 hypothetical protein [Candidatus Thiodiazotropha sp. (ex Codakia orbicularis)]MBV2103857.1 hypothetical protein [Candidatus Thiodiazotropha sp. (ex Lucina aurantia)]MBV2118272.1 hypothetical protein [Candidatus Thiodiazotropha sp. (ex Lucina aurantia)]
MKFSRVSAGRHVSQDIIAAEFTPEEKDMIRRWLETTLKLAFRSGSGHPLEGFVDFLIDIPDASCIKEAQDALEGDETHQDLTGKDFRTLTQLGYLWKEKDLTRLDEKARKNDQFLAKDRYPAMRAYVLSKAYRDEMKAFARIVPDLRRARREIYPHERTVIEVDFEAGQIVGS